MAKQKLNPTLIIILILAGLLFYSKVGFFSIFDGSGYTYTDSLSQDGISLVAKSTRDFGHTEFIQTPETIWYWDNAFSIEGNQIIFNGNEGVSSSEGFGSVDLGTTETLIKTTSVNISTADLDYLSINFDQQTSGALYGGNGEWVKIYLTDGNNDIQIYSAGGTESQQQSGVIKITKLGDDFFLKINAEDSNLISIPQGIYEIIIYHKIQGTVVEGDGPNPLSIRTVISDIHVQKISPSENETCIPSWSCGNWTACASGQKTRICTDSNSCGTLLGRPEINQTCTIQTNQSTNQTLCESSDGNWTNNQCVCPEDSIGFKVGFGCDYKTETSTTSNNYVLYAVIAIIGIVLGIVLLRRKK